MLKTQTAYMESLETIDPVSVREKHVQDAKANPKKAKQSG